MMTDFRDGGPPPEIADEKHPKPRAHVPWSRRVHVPEEKVVTSERNINK